MNVTDLKEEILKIVNPKSKMEISRIKHMYNGVVKYHGMFERMKSIKTDGDVKRFWHDYNIKQAALEKWYKKQKKEMKKSKAEFQDFSDKAYNNSSEDL